VALEQVGIDFQIKGAAKAAAESKKLEMNLRSQARAIDANARALQAEIIQLKSAAAPNRQLIAEKQRLIQSYRLQSQTVRAGIAEMKEGATATKVMAAETDVLSTSMKGLAVSVGEAFKPLLLMFAAFEAANLLKTVDQFNQLQGKIKGSLDSVSEFDAVFQKLIDSSNKTGQSVDDVAQAFVRLRPAAASLGVTNDKLIQFNETFIKMGALAGATSEEVKNAMIQLSQGIASGKLQGDELRSVMESMPQVARTIADSMGIPFEKFKKAASEGKVTAEQVFNAIIKKTGEVNTAFDKLPPSLERSMNRLLNSFRLLAGDLNQATGLTDNLAWFIDKLAGTFENLEKMIRHAKDGMREFFSIDVPKNFLSALSAADAVSGNSDLSALGAMGAKQNNVIAQEYEKRRKELKAKLAAERSVKKPPSRRIPTTPDAKKVNQNKIDSQAIEDVTRSFTHQIEQLKAASDLAIKAMGPFADQGKVLSIQLKEQKDVAALLNSELAKLQHTSVKGADGQRALKEAIQKTKDDITQQKGAVKDASNALQKYKTEIQNADNARNRNQSLADIQKQKDETIKSLEDATDRLSEEYANRKVFTNDYYDSVIANIKKEIDAEVEAHNERLRLLNEEMEERRKLSDEQGIKDVGAKIQDENRAFDTTLKDYNRAIEQATRQRTRDLTQNAKDFGEELQNAISSALQEGFNGGGPLAIIKTFAKNIYSALTQSISKAVAQGFAQSQIYTQITNTVGNFLNSLSGKYKTLQAAAGTQPAKSNSLLPPFFPTMETPSITQGDGGQITLNAGISSVAKKSAPKLSGLMGFAAPIAIAAGSAFNAIKKGGSLFNKYMNFIDPLGIFGIGKDKSKQARAAERAAYQQNTLAPYLNNVVSGADQNNLQSLQASLLQAARGKPGRGSAGMQLKRDAMAQIKQMIEAREKTIAEFIKDIKRQNTELADTILLADAEPIEKAAIQHRIELAKITNETQDLLEQYKDSEAAKTEILQQESLKRQQLAQKEQEDFKAKTQELADLLTQRDDISNANVFSRLRSPEKVKADQLTELDKQIAQTMLELKGMQNAGITGDSLGSNQILGGLNNVTNNLQVTINEANDPNSVREEITRALESFNRKVYGATA
jgi:tape measure domain-containing protein